MDFGRQVGRQMEPKVIQKGIEKIIKAAGGFGSVLVRFQEVQEDEGGLAGGGFQVP